MADKGIGVGECHKHGQYYLDSQDSPCPSCEDGVEMNIDVDLLRKQRDLVLSLVSDGGLCKEESDLMDGLVNLLDALLDIEEGVSYETGETS